MGLGDRQRTVAAFKNIRPDYAGQRKRGDWRRKRLNSAGKRRRAPGSQWPVMRVTMSAAAVFEWQRRAEGGMKAMILAAGRGERLLPLTAHLPKPLLPVGDRSLLEHQLDRLREAGITDFVINVAHLGELIEDRLKDGADRGVSIRYSRESDGPLGTAGGIRRALPLLGQAAFIVANADVYTDFDYAGLPAIPAGVAHLVLVANPAHNAAGDFSLEGTRVGNSGEPRFTFAGIGVYRPALFAALPEARARLAPLLRAAAAQGQVTGQIHHGRWLDVGTPERLATARRFAKGC